MAISTSPATGARGMIHIGEETEYGVAVQPTHLIGFNSEGIAASENVIESEAIRSDRGRHQLIRGNLDIQGDISYEQSAEGFGMLLRHALGDYIKVAAADGGIHARMNRAAHVQTDIAVASITLADDHSGGFSSTGGLFCVVYRDSDNVLQLDANTADAGYSYDSSAAKVRSYVLSFSTPDVIIAPSFGAGGASVNPEFAADGGVIQLGPDRKEYRYTSPVDQGVGNGTQITLNGTDLTNNGAPVANDAAISLGVLTVAAADFGTATIQNGAFVYDYEPTDYAGVITHHLERGRYLPVGLTVEVDRDAAIFLYSGLKANTLTTNFETNTIVSSTISLVGRSEDAMAVLVADIVPGATTITVKKAKAFPAAGTLTINERTGIKYTGKTDNLDGTTDFTGLTGVDRPALKGSSVDCRTSRAVASPVVGNASPLTAFDTVIYVDGYYEEVLSGSFTLNNNLNTDKYGLGSRLRLQLVEQQATVEASLQLEFDDGKFYKRFKESDYFALEFKCISEAADAMIGNTGIPSQAYYFMPKCKFNGNTPLIEGTSYITHEMPVTCVVDDEGSTTDLVIILVNGLDQDVEL